MSSPVSTVIVPKKDSELRAVIALSLGQEAFTHENTEHMILFYFTDDVAELLFNVEQYMANVIRKLQGHQYFLDLMKRFRETVEISNDIDLKLSYRYIPLAQLNKRLYE